MSMFLSSPNLDVLDGGQEKLYAFGEKKVIRVILM